MINWYDAWKVFRRRQWRPTPVLLPGKSHGWRSLEGCSPWGRWGSNMTEWLHFHFLLSCTGEGSGNPLQCSCLENPRDGEAWWAAVYGVTQSRTRLKWLSKKNQNEKSLAQFWHIAVNHSNDAVTEVINDSWYNTTPEGRLLPNFLRIVFRRGRD